MSLDAHQDKEMVELRSDCKMKMKSSIEVVRALHRSVELRLRSTSAAALIAVRCTPKDNEHNVFHLLLTSYKAEHQDVQDMLGGKCKSFNSFPRHTCFVAQTQMK